MPPTTSQPNELPDHLKEINEELYKRNFELAVKNKTLSLLQELYKMSILALDPVPLAERIVETVQKTLEMTLVGIFTANESSETFTLTAYATSPEMKQVLEKYNTSFQGVTIGRDSMSQELPALVADTVPEDVALHIQSDATIGASFTYSLITETRTTGLLWFCLNRPFDTLSQFEQEAINSLVNVVALALDRSFLYKQIRITNDKLKDANEKLKELDASKNEFLSFATHQLRSPLTALKWGLDATVDILKGHQATPEELDMVKRLQITANDMVSTVADLLDISKIEQGGLVMKTEPFDAMEFMDQIAEEFRVTAEKKGLTFTFEPKIDSVKIDADRTKLRQVVVNIIDNSIKYTPNGSVKVTAETDDKNFKVTVADTGPGIAPEELEKLFSKFIRGAAGKSSKGGSGLGLYLAKKIVELHHGTIHAESAGLGKGSSFVVTIPKV